VSGHRLLVEPTAIRGRRVELSAAQSHQVRHVLRLRPGDQVRVFDGETPLDLLVELTGPGEGRVVGEVRQAAEPRHRVVVYPALLQRDKFEPVLRKLTELGATEIVPTLTARGVVREAPDAARLGRWRSILREASEQCGRGVVPSIGGALGLRQAVEAATAQGRAVLAFEGERHLDLRTALEGGPSVVSVFVGPEGGFTLDEVECARQAGARIVTLGPRVLRTETASPVLAALVLYELGDLSWPGDQHDEDEHGDAAS